MKKKIFILTALTVITFSFTACNQNQTSAQQSQVTQPTAASGQDGKLTTQINQESLQPNQSSNTVTVDSTSYIGEDKAMSIALEHAGLTAEELLFSYAKLDMDDGVWVYDVEFYANNKEYDYEIDALSGTILSYDFDMENTFNPNNLQNNQSTAPASGVSIDAAKQIALEQVPGATDDNIRIYTDYDDGRMTYEGKIIYNTMEYEFEIDAATGNITEWDAESIYD